VIYGTPEELARWIDPDSETPDPVPNATILLRAATQSVLAATVGAVYRTEDDGKAKPGKSHDALRDATLEQASALSAANIDPRKGAGAVKPTKRSKGLGGATVTYATDSRTDRYAADLATGVLTQSAWTILSNAGLISTRIATHDNGGVPLYAIPYNPLTGELHR